MKLEGYDGVANDIVVDKEKLIDEIEQKLGRSMLEEKQFVVT